jgi:hypothetical protein
MSDDPYDFSNDPRVVFPPGWNKATQRMNLQAGKLSLLFGNDAAAAPNEQSTVVRGIAHKGSITLVFGKPKSGKSFLATHLGLAVAEQPRELWMGHRIQQHGPVLYVACEGHGGYWKRLKATGEPVPEQFALATGRPCLIVDPEGRGWNWIPHPDDVLAAIEAVRGNYGCLPIMVVIDTVFRSFGGANVNDSSHMNAYVAAAQEIADLGVAVILVHHATKANGTPAGSVSLMGAADTLIHVEKKDGEHVWTVDEAKDDADTPPRKFRLEVVDKIIDGQGEEVSSCKVVDIGSNAQGNGQVAPTPKPRKKDPALELLKALAGNYPNGCVPIGAWRKEYYRKLCLDDSDEARKKAFQRDRKRLFSENAIEADEDLVWIAEPHIQ